MRQNRAQIDEKTVTDPTQVLVTFHPSGRTVRIPPGTLLSDATRAAGLPLAAACDDEGVCGHCRLTVSEGAEHLDPPAEHEARRLDEIGAGPNERLACQAKVRGAVTVAAGYWGYHPKEETMTPHDERPVPADMEGAFFDHHHRKK